MLIAGPFDYFSCILAGVFLERMEESHDNEACEDEKVSLKLNFDNLYYIERQ
jgi:hypothetical protein